MQVIIKTEIAGVYIIEPKIFEDDRGYFFESYNKLELLKTGQHYDFVQDNQSFSTYGTIRGLHLQRGASAQAKLVRVLQGTVLDVAVDVRKDSKTFGKHVAVELSDENKRQLLIPRGLAHGFSVLSDTAVFFYKCSDYYNRSAEASIRYDDPALGIDWRVPADKAIVSNKDKCAPTFKEFQRVYCNR